MSMMQDFVPRHADTLARVQRYGEYWNLMWNNTDVRQRSNGTNFALKRITDALKEMNLLNAKVRDWNVLDTVTHFHFDQAYQAMARINKCLDDAWGWMTYDVNQAAFVFDPNWDAKYMPWACADNSDRHSIPPSYDADWSTAEDWTEEPDPSIEDSPQYGDC